MNSSLLSEPVNDARLTTALLLSPFIVKWEMFVVIWVDVDGLGWDGDIIIIFYWRNGYDIPRTYDMILPNIHLLCCSKRGRSGKIKES